MPLEPRRWPVRYERLNAVLELLAENDHMSVSELADRLAVSAATVRRDLDLGGPDLTLPATPADSVHAQYSQANFQLE